MKYVVSQTAEGEWEAWEWSVEIMVFCCRRNSHGVSLESIQRMIDRYERHVTVASILSSSDKHKDEAERRQHQQLVLQQHQQQTLPQQDPQQQPPKK